MTKEEGLIKILREMDKKRVEELEPNSRKLFDSIMEIANSRDRLLEEKQKIIDYLKEEINKINEQIEHFDLWHEVGVDINFLILKKQMFKEILNRIEKSDK